jgi:hypothetical protein
VGVNQRLVVFFYLMARDRMPMGAVDQLIREVCKVKPDTDVQYSNDQLRAWAEQRVMLLMSAMPFEAIHDTFAWTNEDKKEKVN